MIAFGIRERGSSVSSDSVETASKPRNDRARIAAPAKIAPTSIPDDTNGAVNDFTSTSPVMSPMASAANTTMKTNCAPTSTKFMPASSRMPRMFSPVTIRTVSTIHTGWPMLGK